MWYWIIGPRTKQVLEGKYRYEIDGIDISQDDSKGRKWCIIYL